MTMMTNNNPQADLYLKGAFDITPSQTTPGPIAALDTLMRLTHQMQEMPFLYTFVDKPRAGTSAIIWHDPGRANWPSDGIRYLSQAQDINGPHAGEKFSTSSHPMPNNVSGIVELETGVVSGGIFPPSNPAIPLSKDSPELTMARYRLRWRIITPNLGNLALWLVYWGRDERTTQRAPAGWEKEPIRRYPLPTLPPNLPPQQPLLTGRALPPPPLIESAYSQPPTSASPSPLPQTQTNNKNSRQPSYVNAQQQQHNTPQHQQQQPSLPPNMQPQQAGNYPGYPQQQGRPPPNMQAGPPQGAPQVLHHPQVLQQQQQQQQQSAQSSRKNTPKQSHAAISKKAQSQAQGKANSQQQQHSQQQQTSQPPSNAAIAAAMQPQVNALQAIPLHLRPAVNASAAHSAFPQPFSDPYDYLSSRSWAGIRYERNHAVVAPVFDPSTTSELIESWIEPSYPDLDKIKEEISLLQKEVEALKARQLPLPGRSGLNTTSNNNTEATSQQLARKTSVVSGSIFRDRDGSKQKEVDTLLAPLPRMMPIAEMNDKAMQAYNARRKEMEDALQAQRAAKEEEERIAREQREAEEAAKRASEEEAREKERQEQEAKEAEEWRKAEEERKPQQQGGDIQDVQQAPKLEGSSSQQRVQAPSQGQMQAHLNTQSANSEHQQQPADEQQKHHAEEEEQQQQQQQQPSQALQQSNQNPAASTNSAVFGGGEDQSQQDGGGNGNYFDDSYNLLMDNFGVYGENNGAGFNIGSGIGGDDMMEDSLFSEYMDQMDYGA